MSRTRADQIRFEGDSHSDYGRHVTELRRRARRPDAKARHGRHNKLQSAIKQSEKDAR
jgi:hypothetical protein